MNNQNRTSFRGAVAGLFLLLGRGLAHAADISADAHLEQGLEKGNHVRLLGLGVTVPGWQDLLHGDAWRLDLDWKGRLALWDAHDSDDHRIWDLSLIPTLKMQPMTEGPSMTPFFEAGLGAHVVSSTVVDGRELSSNFQFGETLAAGFSLGEKQAWRIALRAEHVSNGDIKLPNQGITFAGLEISRTWP
jgi:hypothetical protein